MSQNCHNQKSPKGKNGNIKPAYSYNQAKLNETNIAVTGSIYSQCHVR